VATTQIWNGTAIYTTGSGMTPFMLYEDDPQFVSDAPKVADFCARKLGYPMVEVELQSGSLFTCFEEAITEYGAQINQFLMRENMLNLQGSPTSSILQGREIMPNMGRTIKISKMYGSEANVNPSYDIKRGSIQVLKNQTEYDLNDWADLHESGSTIEIRKIYHDVVPAFARYFDPFAGTGMGTYSMMQEFGFTGMSTGVSFLLLPLYADLLRMQSIEFNDMIRRSAFSFRMYNNKIRLTPIPTYDYTLYFDYMVVDDRDNALGSGAFASETGVVSDFSNVPFTNPTYSHINGPGKQWIREYTLALAKELLGYPRGKYSTVPIPGSELSLDGATLRTEGQADRARLITELRENLEKVSRDAQLEKEKNEAEFLKEKLKFIPLGIYVGLFLLGIINVGNSLW